MPLKPTGPWPDDALLGSPVEYGPGATLFRAGDRVQTLLYIVSGRVRLVVARDGGNDVTEGIRYPAWLLGLGPGINGTPHRATAITIESCVLRPISLVAFRLAFESRGEISRWAARCLAADAADGESRMATLGGGGGKFRIRRYFAQQARRSTRRPDGSLRLHDIPTRTDIARAIGVGVVHAGRLRRELLASGELRREKGWFIIPHGSPIMDLIEAEE